MIRRAPPLFAQALAVLAVAMLVPALMAGLDSEWRAARGFLFSAIGTGFWAAILGVALSGPRRLAEGQGELAVLLSVWVVLPVFAAVPVHLITPQIGFQGAWFEMVAAFTTTGSTVYQTPDSVSFTIHLWRGLVGWLGGLLTLTAAYAILAPRRLGGFEVTTRRDLGASSATPAAMELGAATSPVEERVRRALRSIFPIYFGLTVAAGFLFNITGEDEIVGAVHAMSILSTSGITPLERGFADRQEFAQEAIAAVFLVLAGTRLVYARASRIGMRNPVLHDPEVQMMAALVALVTAAFFLRHWFGALTVAAGDVEGVREALAAFWGGFFTALSFLTTTGLESGFWDRAQDWSGLSTPGLVLLGLCAIGGGGATTTGGIKLIRAFALMRHGVRELDRLAQPNAVMGVGSDMRGLMRQGAFIAWAFVMLYVVAVFGVTLALTLTGQKFDVALIGALSAITNTGPAFGLIVPGQEGYALVEPAARYILAVGMVLGRVETLVVIALLSPDVWRRLSSRKKTAGKPRHQPSQSGR